MQALQSQMNPHFIFNCVAGIQYYILTNQKDEVLGYLSDFSKVVRVFFANASLRMVPLGQEISFLKSYLRLEKMRFSDKFDYSIGCVEEDSIEYVCIPPMLIQPFIENSIRHGFAGKSSKGFLSVVFEEAKPGIIRCTITDDGCGRDHSAKQNSSMKIDERPHSVEITESRIRLLNNHAKPTKYTIEYTDLSEGGVANGLKVELYIPMEPVLNQPTILQND